MFAKEFFEKVYFEKSQQTTKKTRRVNNYPTCNFCFQEAFISRANGIKMVAIGVGDSSTDELLGVVGGSSMQEALFNFSMVGVKEVQEYICQCKARENYLKQQAKLQQMTKFWVCSLI